MGLNISKSSGCDNSTVHLTCPNGLIMKGSKIKYGRFDNNTCKDNSISSSTKSEYKEYSIPEKCLDKKECSFEINSQTFGEDPSPGLSKQFELILACFDTPNENEIAHILKKNIKKLKKNSKKNKKNSKKSKKKTSDESINTESINTESNNTESNNTPSNNTPIIIESNNIPIKIEQNETQINPIVIIPPKTTPKNLIYKYRFVIFAILIITILWILIMLKYRKMKQG